MATDHIIEGILLDDNHAYTIVELCEICVIEKQTVIELVEYGIIEPKGAQEHWEFSSKTMLRTKKALRLHKDLAINWAGISLALELLDEILELRQQVALQHRPK